MSGFFQYWGSVETIQNTYFMSRSSRKGLTLCLRLPGPSYLVFNQLQLVVIARNTVCLYGTE